MDDDEFDDIGEDIVRDIEKVEKILRGIYGSGVSSSDALEVMIAMHPLMFDKKSEVSDAGEALKTAVAEIRRVRRHLISLPPSVLEQIEENAEAIAVADDDEAAESRAGGLVYRSFDGLLSAIESDLARGRQAVEKEREEHWKGKEGAPICGLVRLHE